MEGPQQTVLPQHPHGDRPDQVELVGEIQPHPFHQAEVDDDAFLHCPLVPTGHTVEAIRRRNWELEPFAPREQNGDRQDRGRRATAGEAHQARRAEQRREDRLLERLTSRQGDLGRRQGIRRREAEDEPRCHLQRSRAVAGWPRSSSSRRHRPRPAGRGSVHARGRDTSSTATSQHRLGIDSDPG